VADTTKATPETIIAACEFCGDDVVTTAQAAVKDRVLCDDCRESGVPDAVKMADLRYEESERRADEARLRGWVR
jgi:ribosome-binding protein aMBF1 (putative translation factor)